MRALVIGNGESRAWFKPNQIMANDVMTWGCNAIYRDDGYVHNLVSVDYGMQQEIYDSDYCLDNPEFADINNCFFANWSVVPSEAADMMLMGYNIPEEFIHKSKRVTNQCVISGKDPTTLQEKIDIAIQMNPHLDMKDLKLKMEKDVGIWITYVCEDDNVIPIDYPVGWSAGNTALYLASQNAQDVYVLGFDLSSYDAPLNNIYKGTKNYLPTDTKGFSPDNWYNQMRTMFRVEDGDTQYYLVDSTLEFEEDSVTHITKSELCKELEIV